MFVKICGITCDTDARMAASAGANAIGVNFCAASPRCVNIAAAREIVQSLPSFVDPVGVFVNAGAAEIRQVARQVGVRTVQLHGDVSAELIAELREFSVITAVSLVDESSIPVALDLVAACDRLGRMPNALLVDALVAGKFGGTGKVAPWNLARLLVDRSPVPIALAGGLTVKNVGEAIRTVRPWGVDVASGVEVAPGRKEAHKVRTFIEAARKAAAGR